MLHPCQGPAGGTSPPGGGALTFLWFLLQPRPSNATYRDLYAWRSWARSWGWRFIAAGLRECSGCKGGTLWVLWARGDRVTSAGTSLPCGPRAKQRCSSGEHEGTLGSNRHCSVSPELPNPSRPGSSRLWPLPQSQPGPLGTNKALGWYEEKHTSVNGLTAAQHPVRNIIYEAAPLPVLLGKALLLEREPGRSGVSPGSGTSTRARDRLQRSRENCPARPRGAASGHILQDFNEIFA